ncbi:MAG: (Fe-S)-binding protein [Bacteroidia bacterium]
MIVDIFIPCYIDQFFPQTAFNMVKVLEKVGCAVNYNVEQTCCGMPAFHDGYLDNCKEVGTKFIHEFQNDHYIISPGGACVSMIKNHYPEMFHNSLLHNEYKSIQKNIYELSDFLVNVMKIVDVEATLAGVAFYHDNCNALRELKIYDAPRTLLKNVKGLSLKEIEEPGLCCGWGGAFAGKFEPLAVAMAEEKINQIIKSGARYIISTDIGCLMHMDGYIKKNNIPLKTMHIADVLAAY